MTGIMILFFAVALFLTDGLKKDNPMNTYQALMQVINCRTAGFTMYPQSDISLPGRMLCCVMMFVGGAPLSTAGGIKLTTIFVVLVSILSYFRGKKTSVFKRYYSEDMTAKSLSLVFVVLFLLLFSFVGLNLFGLKETSEPLNENIKNELVAYYLYEVFSAFGNVGFYTGLESHLSMGSVIILCLLMLLGHLGPMTFFSLFQNHLDKKKNVHYSFVEEDFLIG
jgi:trk system potassium uptake protein TrkH